MARSVEGFSGLALRGGAQVGPLRFPVPTVAWTRRPSDRLSVPTPFPLAIDSQDPKTIGHRSVRLTAGEVSLGLEYPVPVPEVSGVQGSVHEAAPGVWVVHAPLEDEEWTRLSAARPEMIVLGNARTLYAEGERFEETLGTLRDRLGAGPLLWTPRLALPHRLAFLTYVGIDLLDTTEGRWLASSGRYLDASLGELPAVSSRREGLCDCSDCTGEEPPSGAHVARSYGRELALVRTALAAGRLRELVELRLSAEPALAEHLRYADRLLGPRLEDRTPVVGEGKLGYVLRESQRRPEVTRFLARLLERYQPPPSKEVLLVLPCSKTKPYRASPSHRRYLGALEGVPHLERLHVVSVTSPLGIVPRELEDVYPARHYDIPVTGEWDEEERRRVLSVARHLLTTGRYRKVILHLDPQEYEFLGELSATQSVAWSAPDERTLSPDALRSLRTNVSEGLSESVPLPGGPLAMVREELREVAAFQFGRDAADRLFAPPVRLAGRPWFQRLTDGKHADLATWREERGLFHLTVAGARRLLEVHPLEVEVAEGVPLRGDLFTPGVARADPSIRIGDAVILARRGELLGVGEAELPGRLMTELPHGRAVEVRHRVHTEMPEAPTPT